MLYVEGEAIFLPFFADPVFFESLDILRGWNRRFDEFGERLNFEIIVWLINGFLGLYRDKRVLQCCPQADSFLDFKIENQCANSIQLSQKASHLVFLMKFSFYKVEPFCQILLENSFIENELCLDFGNLSQRL